MTNIAKKEGISGRKKDREKVKESQRKDGREGERGWGKEVDTKSRQVKMIERTMKTNEILCDAQKSCFLTINGTNFVFFFVFFFSSF